MRHFAIYLIFISAFAQAQTDTFWLKEATIKANRFMPVFKMHQADSTLKTLGSDLTVAGLFQRENYLYNRQYGIGGIQTPGLRGLSAQQTTVLWNGIPIGSPMLGLSDLSTMPVYFSDDLSIEPGPSSSINGNAAMGGTLHFQNEPVKQNFIKAQVAYNSMRNKFATIQGGLSGNGFYMSLKALYRDDKNEFDYRNASLPGYPLNMNSARSHQSALMHEMGFKTKRNSQLNIRSWFNLSNRELPKSMLVRNRNVMTDNFIRTMGDFAFQRKNVHQVFRASFSSEYNHYKSRSPDIENTNRFQAMYISSETEITNSLGKWAGIAAFYHAGGESGNYALRRVQSYFQAGLNHEYSIKRWQQVTSFKWMDVNTGLNPLAISSFTSWNPRKGKLFFLNLSNGFRIPTLNEMYWVPGGNPELLPEKSLHAETGCRIHYRRIEWKQQVYYTPTRNLVRWYPSGPGVVSPFNIPERAEMLGMESSVNYPFIKGKHEFRLRGSWNVNLALTGKPNDYAQLDYVPIHSAYGEILWSFKTWMVLMSNHFTSARNVQSDKLPGFYLVQANITYEIKNIRFFIDVNNILNTEYQMIAWYPMPGRNVQLRAQILFTDN